MRKIVLNSQQSGSLLPNWYELDLLKLDRLKTVFLRNSHINGYHLLRVMSCPAILIDPCGFILNGKHRAVTSFSKGYSLDVCIIETENDLFHHTPKECYGETGLKGMLEAWDNRVPLIAECQMMKVYSVRDLARNLSLSPQVNAVQL